MDFSPSEEQQLIIDNARAFVRNELLPHEDLVEAQNAVPDDLFEQIRRKAIESGLFAANIPEEYGGGGLDALTFALVEGIGPGLLCVAPHRASALQHTRGRFA